MNQAEYYQEITKLQKGKSTSVTVIVLYNVKPYWSAHKNIKTNYYYYYG